MQTLASKLQAAGLIQPPVVLGPPKPPTHLLRANALFHKRTRSQRPKAHFADVGLVLRQSMRNPSTSGSMHAHARTVDAAGSDVHKAYKMSGPSVTFGWKAQRGGQSHADMKRDYWTAK